MKRISQKSFQQAGVIITDDDRVIPYFAGEDPIIIASRVLKETDAKIDVILACFNPVEFGRDNYENLRLSNLKEEFMTCLRTGFMNVSQYGFNRYMNKGVYA